MEHSPEQPPQTAQEAYEQQYDVALDTLAAIRAKLLADHDNGQPKDWSDVGNQKHLVQGLTDLAEFLGI